MHTTLLDIFTLGHAFLKRKLDILFTLPWWLWGAEIHSYDVWLVVFLLSMFDLEMLTLGHNPLIDDRFCEMIIYVRHILLRDYFTLRAYPFREDAFILGRNHLVDFDIETLLLVYYCCFWWIIESLTPWVQSSQHTWFNLDTHFPLLDI